MIQVSKYNVAAGYPGITAWVFWCQASVCRAKAVGGALLYKNTHKGVVAVISDQKGANP